MLRVIGRIRILIDSIMVRGGLSHIGAPVGRRLLADTIRETESPEMIKVNHRGSPVERENNRCAVVLNM